MNLQCQIILFDYPQQGEREHSTDFCRVHFDLADFAA